MSLMQTFRQWLGKSTDDGQTGRRPDGGTSCYRPNRKTDGRAGTTAAPEAVPDQSGNSVPYVHTGFTDMNPPQSDVYPPETAAGQTDWNGWTQPPRTAYNNGYQPNASARTQTIQGAVRDRPQGQGRRSGRRRAGEDASNVFFMPGAFREQPMQFLPQTVHILNMSELKSCYEAIDCMKNGETVIALLDVIASEGDMIRCQDMLAGAAFTLGCTVRLLSGPRIILVAPQQVRILPEEAPGINTQPINPIEEMAAGGSEESLRMFETRTNEYPRRRRVSQNTRGWRPGEDRRVNPYTGTMPAASGAYGEFGGFR